MTAAGKAVRWWKMPFWQYVKWQIRQPETAPFLVFGNLGVLSLAAFVHFKTSEEDKLKSKYYSKYILGNQNQGGH